MTTDSIKLFISYSHDDDRYFKVFSEQLKKVVKNSESFEWKIWDDTNIYVGTFWDDEIQFNIKECNIALLLVSVGFMSSKYIREKEYNEFIKRYQEKGILIVPIMFQPCDFNRWEDLGKLQFFKPKGAKYEKPSIENFTYADLIKFTETDGSLLPNPNAHRYVLDLVKKIEESFKEFSIRTIKKEVIIDTPPLQTNLKINKLSDYPKPSVLFTGRKAKIDEFKITYDSFRLFAIEGLGGTGKTQFAAKCIDEIITDKNKIIWLNGSAQSNFNVFVENIGYGDVLKGENKTNLALYSGLKDLLERDSMTLFWDNYNDYEDPEFADFFSFTHQYLQNATIILITKTEPAILGLTPLPIILLEGLDTNNDAIEYAKKLKASNNRYSSIIDADLEKICSTVEGHPLAIEFSMWLMGYGKPIDEILFHMPEMSGLKKVEQFSKRLFFDIFNHPATSDEERDCFLKCSVFKERITESEIKYLYDGKDVFHLLVGLIDKLLITSKDGCYEIHPLVRSFSYEKLNNKPSIHKKAANYFILQRIKTLNAALEEKIFYHLSEAQELEIIADNIEANGKKFIQQGQLGLISEFLNKVVKFGISRPIFDILYGDILQIKGEWDKSNIYFERASKQLDDINIKAEGIIKFGEIVFRKGDIKESLQYFEEAYQFARKYSLIKEEARALNDIGLVYFDFDKLDLSYEKINSALELRHSINDLEGICQSYNNIANIFKRKKQFLKALEYHDKSMSISEEMNDKVMQALTFYNIGDIFREQNRLEESLIKNNIALQINEEIGDKLGISHCLNNVGLIYIDQGRESECLLKFEESCKIAQEIGDKRGVSTVFNNFGAFHFGKNHFEKALHYFFKSHVINIQTGAKQEQKTCLNWISSISIKIGKEKFKELATQVYQTLSIEEQKNLQLRDFFNEPIKRDSIKVGRNDPCPCGSSKKYKNCHGASLHSA